MEKILHNSLTKPGFIPFQCFQANVAEQTSKAAHTHGSHEFFICTDSQGYQFARNMKTPHHRGAVFCFPAGMAHYCSGLPGKTTVGYVIMVPSFMYAQKGFGDSDTAATLKRAVELAQAGRSPLPIHEDTSPALLSIAHEMADEASQKKPGYQAASRLLLQKFLLLLMRDPVFSAGRSLREPANHNEEKIARVIRLIDAHFMEEITVKSITTMAAMSRSHFHAVFRSVVGCTMIDYLTCVRIKAAQRMLAETDTTILQIAMDCGFRTTSRFYDAFKSVTGKKPRAFRSE